MLMSETYIRIEREKADVFLYCSDHWTLDGAHRITKEMMRIHLPQKARCIIDFSGVEGFDTAGVLLLLDLQEALHKQGNLCDLTGLSEKQQKILELVKRGYSEAPLPQRKEGILERLGRAAYDELQVFRDFLSFLGELSARTFGLFLKPGNFRFKETAYHIEHSGVDALFIIALTSILVGLVIAYESLVQLAQFGADIYVVDGIGISITRELGPMITAIVIAGRSASSYTAEIGTMRLTEEISAMRTMGFDPFYFLVIPRIVALMLALPLLIFFSDVMGILGGMLASKAQVDISYSFFLQRLQEVLAAKHYILGMIKGPFFALIIAATGCFHGFRVTGDTESIGIETTASVVHAIFFVIACDALFAVIYTQLGY